MGFVDLLLSQKSSGRGAPIPSKGNKFTAGSSGTHLQSLAIWLLEQTCFLVLQQTLGRRAGAEMIGAAGFDMAVERLTGGVRTTSEITARQESESLLIAYAGTWEGGNGPGGVARIQPRVASQAPGSLD